MQSASSSNAFGKLAVHEIGLAASPPRAVALLEALRPARDALVKASGRMATRSVYKAATDTLTGNMDELAGCLAGDRTYFHAGDSSPRPRQARDEDLNRVRTAALTAS